MRQVGTITPQVCNAEFLTPRAVVLHGKGKLTAGKTALLNQTRSIKMEELTLTMSLEWAAYNLDCVEGLPYRLKNPQEYEEGIAYYAVPEETRGVAYKVECVMLGEDLEPLGDCVDQISPRCFGEKMFDFYKPTNEKLT